MPGEAALATLVVRRLAEAGPVRAGDRVLIGLSGGLDSVCLLHLLRFASPLPLALHAAHFDHALREVSARDAQWVSGLCRAWSVPLLVERAEVPPRGEAAARLLRYEFLQRAAADVGAAWVLTAHQADDQLETLLFRLARGTGLCGLRGIPERRGNIIRPLLSVRRATLLQYARGVRLRWREDESNRSLRISRNRIRHSLLPALEGSWPAAGARLLQLSDLAVGLERMWQRLLPELVGSAVTERSASRIVLAREVLREYHPHTRARALRYSAQLLGAGLDRAGTAVALRFSTAGESGNEVRLGGGLRLHREFERLTMSRSEPAREEPSDLPLSIRDGTAGNGRARIGGRWLDVSWGPQPPAVTGASASFDPSALHFPLVLRGWRPGDRIRLRYGTKKLKKLFAERRVPRSRRAGLPVLAEQAGEGGVLWIASIAQAAPAPGAMERWHITVQHGESA